VLLRSVGDHDAPVIISPPPNRSHRPPASLGRVGNQDYPARR
jgi:hypothetical protein